MLRPPREFPLHRAPATRALIAVLLALSALGGGVTARGSALTSGAGREAAHRDHHLHCKCATRCRGSSCCCGPGASAEAPPVRAPLESLANSIAHGSDTDTDAGPCMEAAPCSGGVPTIPSPIVRIVDTAALLAGCSPPAIDPGASLAPLLPECLPEVTSSRPEEPPERRRMA